MIAFITLLLGLVSGTVPIEVATGGPVARVEILLDGTLVRTIGAPPWKAAVPLGDGLAPHELVARALDEGGREIARTAQWINLPRPPAEVDIVLESGPDGAPRSARLAWQNVANRAPSSVGLTFDGDPLVLDSERRASLPRHDLATAHLLEAEVRFGAGTGVVARNEVVFGGAFGATIATELTAIPVRLTANPKRNLTPSTLQGRFSVAGEALDVAAIEDGDGQVVVVRVSDSKILEDRWVPFDQGFETRGAAPNQQDIVTGSSGAKRDLHSSMTLGADTVTRLMSPSPRSFGGASGPEAGKGLPSDLFDVSPDLSARDGGLLRFLTRANLSSAASRREAVAVRIADAVAVAGLQASAGNRRRAVVLVLGDKEGDASRYGAEAVRRYLAAIRVPLFVWSPTGKRNPAATGWGEVEDVSSLPKLHQAFERLKADLDSQRIVWVEGRHLPQRVALTPGGGSVETLVPERPEGMPRAELAPVVTGREVVAVAP